MESLRALLRQAGIYASSVAPLFGSGPDEVFGLVVQGAQAVSTWQRLRERVEQTEYWPVLLGDDAALAHLRDVVKRLSRLTPEKILAEAETIDPVTWFENRYLDELDEVQTYRDELDNPQDQAYWDRLLAVKGALRGLPQGPWPDEFSPQTRFWIPSQSSGGEPLPRVHVGLLPTRLGWQSPAYLRFGAWNNCPSPGENVALLKYWQDCYGAEVVGIAGDVVELQVARPPQTQEDALRLAKQQFLYCQDIVVQGTETLQGLAAALLGGTVWFFWWD
jgi:hypothetical protein